MIPETAESKRIHLKAKGVRVGSLVKVTMDGVIRTAVAKVTKIKHDMMDPGDYHWIYKLEVLKGPSCDLHRNNKGELWANAYEIKALRIVSLGKKEK